MKVKVSIVIFFILISFFNMGAVSTIKLKQNTFDNIETITEDKSEFIENGVKIQYKTKNNITSEVNRIKDYLKNNISLNVINTSNNEFQMNKDKFSLKLKLWNDERYTYEEITLINNNLKYKTNDLIKIADKLISTNKAEDVEEFLYYKGKILSSDSESIKSMLIEKSHAKDNILNINNGCTGVGYLNNGKKLNFAISKYDTGVYVIIGTPIIFATY